MKTVILFVFLLILVNLNTNCCATENEYIVKINTGNIKMRKISFEGEPIEENNNEVPSSMLADVLGPTTAVTVPKKEASKRLPPAEDDDVPEDDE